MLLFALLLLRTNVIMAMLTPSQMNIELPLGFREIMLPELIKSAKLASDAKFDESIKVLKELYKDNKHFNAEIIYSELKENYDAYKKIVINNCDRFDLQHFTPEEYIYEYFLEYFWWDFYEPVYAEEMRCPK
jgi:hypothetical protein